MDIVSRGFRGRRRDSSRQLPPGTYPTNDFPVLSAGPTPRIPLDAWEFTITTELGESHRWSWAELMGLPAESITADIHCVTRWSKLDTVWRGVSLDTLLADIETEADFALVRSYGGYSTNLPLERLLDGGQVAPRHRPDAAGLSRLLGATWLPRLRRPMARAAIPGGLKVRRAW